MEEIALLECREYRYDLLKKVIDEQFELLGFQKIVKQGCSVVLMEKKDTMEAYEAYGKRNGFYAVRKFDASDSLAM